jgi:hypothetical protein
MTRISIGSYQPGHLSFSTINSYRSCGKKLELQKILRLEEKPGLAAIGGNAVHVATEAYDRGEWVPSSAEVDIVRAEAENGSTDEGSAK